MAIITENMRVVPSIKLTKECHTIVWYKSHAGLMSVPFERLVLLNSDSSNLVCSFSVGNVSS